MKRVLLGALLVVGALDASPALACTCAGYRSFLDVARDSPLTVIGKVVAIGERRYSGPVWMDLAVEWVAKGAAQTRIVRVWDWPPSSDCGSLGEAKVGRSFAIAVSPSTPDVRTSDLWAKLAVDSPKDADFVVGGSACQTPILRLKASRDRKAWIGRRLD